MLVYRFKSYKISNENVQFHSVTSLVSITSMAVYATCSENNVYVYLNHIGFTAI